MAYGSSYNTKNTATSNNAKADTKQSLAALQAKNILASKGIDNIYDTSPVQITEMGGDKYVDNLVIKELTSKTLTTSFGREEDYVELHIHNTINQLLYKENNFRDYTTENTGNTSTSLIIDPEKILRDRGYIAGQYKIILHIHRNKIFNSAYFPFEIKEISSNRREIKSFTPEVVNNLLDSEVNFFISEIESTAYFKEFSLNFGNGIIIPAINILLNTDPLKHELILKTLDPLPSSIARKSLFKVVEELTDPISVDVDLGDPQINDDSIELREPNFQINVKQNSSIPSTFKTYDDLLKYNITSSYNHLLNKLENPDTLNINYDHIRNVSSSMEGIDIPYHFENFVHFSSAVERLKNFQYKLKLIETYDSEVAEIQLVEGAITSSSTILTTIENVKKKKQNLIKGFDGYEHFLYFTSGSDYTWPKSNTSPPYNLYSISSSNTLNWLGQVYTNSPSGSGQLLSASLFDNKNPYNLNKLIPEHIKENSDNNFYVSFVDMIGQHFDHIWTYIKHLTELNNLDNKFGVSKELVYFTLKSLGIDTFDQFENSNLIEYILGEGLQDHSVGNLIIGDYIVGGLSNNFYNTEAGISTYVTASNDGSIPKKDITREIWKRLYNNAPYLLETKGTERGLRALMSCYGVPSTILNVKEYGGSTLASGPLKDLDTSDTYKTFSYDKSGLALKGYATGSDGYFIKVPWGSQETLALSSSAKTITFRIKPERSGSGNHYYHLCGLSGSFDSDTHLLLLPHNGSDISSSGDYTQYGRLEIHYEGCTMISTGKFPVFNGEFWNVFMSMDGVSGSTGTLTMGAYQSNFLKHVTHYTASEGGWTELSRSRTWGDPYYNNTTDGLGVNSSGSQFVYFGGVESKDDVDTSEGPSGKPYSGSLQEIKIYFHKSGSGVSQSLSHETLKKQALEPFMYAGNSISSSYDELVLRLPLGSNDQQNSESFHPNIDVNYLEFAGVGYSAIGSGFTIGVNNYDRRTFSNISDSSQEWEEVIEEHHLPTPDTVGASMTSEKVRIDATTIPSDNILLVDKKRETSTLDRQPPDYEDLGIYFSPTSEINEDILYTLGSFRLDDYIGNPLPSAQSASFYGDLKDIQEIYRKKLRDKYNYWDYIKLIQDFDHTLFKIIEQFVPFRANTKTGLLIEPTYLERTKFAREVPVRSDAQTMVTGSHQTLNVQISTNYSGNAAYSFASSSQQTKTGFGYDKFPMSRGGFSASVGRYEPGSYVVSDNNLTFETSSKTSERIERGTNATIEIHDEYLDPFKRKKNQYGALHSNNGQACQAPIRPFVQSTAGVAYGIGAAAIGTSFTIGEYYGFGAGTPSGIEFASIGGTFTIGEYGGGLGVFSIGTATIGSTFIVGTFTTLPQIDFNYRTHKSNTLLGNVMVGRKSKKYFKYTTFTLE